MRCFISVDFNPISDYLRAIQGKLKHARFTFPKDFHCTLRFLGEIDSQEETVRLLSEVRHNIFTSHTSSIDAFPSFSNPRVIWIGIEGEMHSLKEAVDTALHIGSEGFIPHITLARVKFINDRERLIEEIRNIKTEKMEVQVSSFSLMQSMLEREGPRYKELAKFELCK